MGEVEAQLYAHHRMLKEVFRNSLHDTCKFLLGYQDVNQYTHGEVFDALEDSATQRKLVLMPRGSLKSSIGVVGYAIWLLLRNPNLRILIDSEKYENSKNFIREIRHKLELQRVTELFGRAAGPVWGEGEITVAWRTQGFKEASITASGIAAGKTGAHYDVIICDDLNTNENSATPEGRAKVITHYKLNLSILEPHGTMVVIGTRYSADDVYGFILDNEVNTKLEGAENG